MSLVEWFFAFTIVFAPAAWLNSSNGQKFAEDFAKHWGEVFEPQRTERTSPWYKTPSNF